MLGNYLRLILQGSVSQCDIQRWQPDWVAISYAHKQIAIIDLCRQLDVHEDRWMLLLSTRRDTVLFFVRLTSTLIKGGSYIFVSPTHWKPRPVLSIDLKLLNSELSEAWDSDSGDKLVG
jgi:hypothetical protein